MRALLLVLFSLMSSNSFSQDKVLLVTSFNRPQERKLKLNRKRQDLYHGLESDFRKEFKSSHFLLDIMHEMDAYKLFQLVKTGNYKGIFWVSHADEGTAFSDGLASENVILDKNGINVKDIFYHLHPNTSFLSLIGCYSKSFADELVAARPEFKNRIHGHSNKVDILHGLRSSMKAFKDVYYKSGHFAQVIQMKHSKIDLKIIRTSEASKLPPLFVYNKKALIRVLPPLRELSRSSYKMQIDVGQENEDFKIIVSTQNFFDHKESSHDFGDLVISMPDRKYGRYNMLTLNNKPIGVRSRIFKYVEEIPAPAVSTKAAPAKKSPTHKKPKSKTAKAK